MKVLLVTPDTERQGGIANYYRVLRSHLGPDVEYFVVGPRRDGQGRWKTCSRTLRDYRDFHRKIKRGGYDIVHVNPSLVAWVVWREGIFTLIARRYCRRVIVFFRGWHAHSERRIRATWLTLFRALYFKASAFIVLSEQNARVLKELGCTRPIFVETTVVADEVFASPVRHAPGKREAERETEFRVLFLSRVERTKGVYEALEAVAILRAMRPHVTLTIAGNGHELAGLKAYVEAHRLAWVRFAGHVAGQAKEAVFAQADVYLLPTYGEGMPNSVLEAMGYGLPIVTRPVGGLCDFFEEGRMGMAIDSLDPREFAEALRTLVDDPVRRAQIGQYNREYARRRFRASEVAARLERIYGAVMEAAPGVPWSGGPEAIAPARAAQESLAAAVCDSSDLTGK